MTLDRRGCYIECRGRPVPGRVAVGMVARREHRRGDNGPGVLKRVAADCTRWIPFPQPQDMFADDAERMDDLTQAAVYGRISVSPRRNHALARESARRYCGVFCARANGQFNRQCRKASDPPAGGAGLVCVLLRRTRVRSGRTRAHEHGSPP